ncbi:MAG: SDR family NAD(P)-dependent oxidoreductase, partial [Acidimicrobiaceae bacterium]|nr:SDR family NAD(P)-dependent oxidoreductase [Acidimicrobiaceae bacterium]
MTQEKGFCIDLAGRRALVTGAGQGVGRAIACALAEAGATALVNDVRPELAREAVEQIRAAGGAAEAAPFDVTDFEGVQTAVAQLGDVHILVNNAGNAGAEGFVLGPFAESRPADWARYLNVNLFGVMHCTRAVLPRMTRLGYGRIVTIVSDAGRWG